MMLMNDAKLDGVPLTAEALRARCRCIDTSNCLLDVQMTPIVLAGLHSTAVREVDGEILVTQRTMRDPDGTDVPKEEMVRIDSIERLPVWLSLKSGAYITDRDGTLFVTSYDVIEDLDGLIPPPAEVEE